MPGLYIITGSNGAGKSTVGISYFPEHITTVFDGDKLYLEEKGRLWKSGIKVQKELKAQASEYVERMFLSLVELAIENREDFAYEGHFSHDSSWNIIQSFKEAGYSIHLVFFGLTSPKLSSNRVLIRAKEGGHSVDEITLRENFFGNLTQLDTRFAIFDSLLILDTSTTEHIRLMWLNKASPEENFLACELPGWFKEHLPNLLKT